MAREQPDDLWMAYQRTTYVARAPGGPVHIRIGQPAPEVDRHLAEAGRASWAFISAWNPGSLQLSLPENRARHDELVREVEDRGWPAWEGEGVGDAGLWPPEPSLLVLGPSRAEARALGALFGQNAVVWGAAGGVAELVDCR